MPSLIDTITIEYNENNKEHLSMKHKEYAENNKEHIMENSNEHTTKKHNRKYY